MSSSSNLGEVEEDMVDLKGTLKIIMDQQTKILESNEQILSRLKESNSNNGGNNNSLIDMESAVVPRPVQLAPNKKGINTVKKLKLNKDNLIQALNDSYRHPSLSTEEVYKGLTDAAYFRVNILLQRFKKVNNRYPTWKALGPTTQNNLILSVVRHSKKKGIDVADFEENWLISHMTRKTYQNQVEYKKNVNNFKSR